MSLSEASALQIVTDRNGTSLEALTNCLQGGDCVIAEDLRCCVSELHMRLCLAFAEVLLTEEQMGSIFGVGC